MSNRQARQVQADVVFFLMFVLALGVGWWVHASTPEDDEHWEIPDFSLPGIELAMPIELPESVFRIRRPEVPRLRIGRDTEQVIVEVRRVLIASSAVDEEDVELARPKPVAPAAEAPSGSALAARLD